MIQTEYELFTPRTERESVFSEPSLTGQPEQQTAQSEHQNTTPTSHLDRQTDEQNTNNITQFFSQILI